jgi:hypothetical protein
MFDIKNSASIQSLTPKQLRKLNLLLTFTAILLVIALVSGCKSTESPLPVYGLSSEVNQLIGKWYGEYTSSDTGRHGRIYFDLRAEADSAIGHVIMDPEAREMDDAFDDQLLSSRLSEALTIRFVSIGEGHIVGRLDPYKDPNCGCKLDTIFEGHLNGDKIEGIFASHRDVFHLSTSGQWWVEKIAPR